MGAPHTVDDEDQSAPSRHEAPCVVLAFAHGAPAFRRLPLTKGRITLGRGSTTPFDLNDERISREHAEVKFEGGRWHVRDLGSRNGTWVDGEKILRDVSTSGDPVVRIGHVLMLCVRDERALDGPHDLENGDLVAGPLLCAALATITRSARADTQLLLLGESGTGKELAARRYHAEGPFARGPLVDVNCATIPEGLAERLLFGARRGAYSGAVADVEGYLQSAERGVLFLDEVGTLDLDVQAKLLRVLETRQVAPLGSSTARPLDFRVVAATNSDLRKAVAEGQFRSDLFFRLAQEQVVLPPLRRRREEIPYLVGLALRRVQGDLRPSARLMEACLTRTWQGNVRERLLEVRRAGQRALDAREDIVSVDRLDEKAGIDFGAATRPNVVTPTPSSDADPRKEEILAALRKTNGNVAEVARAMGLHRTQLYRLMRKLGIEQRWD